MLPVVMDALKSYGRAAGLLGQAGGSAKELPTKGLGECCDNPCAIHREGLDPETSKNLDFKSVYFS